jgi:hypothetical protein
MNWLSPKNPKEDGNTNSSNYTKYFNRNNMESFSVKKPKYVIQQNICSSNETGKISNGTCETRYFHYGCTLPTLFTTPSCIYIDINNTEFTKMIPIFWKYKISPHTKFIQDFYENFYLFHNMLLYIYNTKTTASTLPTLNTKPLFFSKFKITNSAGVSSNAPNTIEETSMLKLKNDLLKSITFFEDYVKYVKEFKDTLNSATPYFNNKFDDNYTTFIKLTNTTNAMLNPDDKIHTELFNSISEIIIDIKGDMYIYQLNHLVEYEYKKSINADLSPNAPDTVFKVRTKVDKVRDKAYTFAFIDATVDIPLEEFEKHTNQYGKLYSSLKIVIDMYESAVKTWKEIQKEEEKQKKKDNKTGFKVPNVRVYYDGEFLYPVIMRTDEYKYYVLTETTPENEDNKNKYIYPNHETEETQPDSSTFESKSIFEVIQSLYTKMMDEYHTKSKTIHNVLYEELTELNEKIKNIKTEFIDKSTTTNMDWLPNSNIDTIYKDFIKYKQEDRVKNIEYIEKNLTGILDILNNKKINDIENVIRTNVFTYEIQPKYHMIDETAFNSFIGWLKNTNNTTVLNDTTTPSLEEFINKDTLKEYKSKAYDIVANSSENGVSHLPDTINNIPIISNKLTNICTKYRTKLFGINMYNDKNSYNYKIPTKIKYNNVYEILVIEKKNFGVISSRPIPVQYYPWCKPRNGVGSVLTLGSNVYANVKESSKKFAENVEFHGDRAGQVVKGIPTGLKNRTEFIRDQLRYKLDDTKALLKDLGWMKRGGSTHKTHRANGNRTRKYKHVHKVTRNNGKRHANNRNKQNTRKARKH